LRPPEDSQSQPLARMDGDPVFDEPWQAQILALADTLARAGAFTPRAWSEALGAALDRAAASGAPDGPTTYYAAALEALEGLLDSSGAVGRDALSTRRDAWERAYLETPHGQPVALSRK
jgi:nitrile hydratase accessory protein